MSYDINRVVLVGRLSNDVELKTVSDGKQVARFGLAVSTGKDSASFFNIVVWGKSAEFCGQYMHKGDRIGIDGRLEQRSWTTGKGEKRSVIEVIAERVESLTAPKGGQTQDNGDVPF